MPKIVKAQPRLLVAIDARATDTPRNLIRFERLRSASPAFYLDGD